TVEQVVEGAITGELPLERRPEVEEADHDQRDAGAAPERVRHERVPPDREIEARHEAQRADQPAEVPVRLRAVRRRVRVERAPEPDRIDLHEPAEQEEHAGDREQEAERTRRLARPRWHADDVPLALTAPS